MARPRIPTEVKILSGTFRKDRDGSPELVKADGVPTMPAHLEGEASAWWERNVPSLVERGIAKACDADVLAAMAEWWGRYRKFSEALDAGGTEHTGKLCQLSLLACQAWDKFDRIAARFGLTPSDRAKMRAEVKGTKGKVAARKRG